MSDFVVTIEFKNEDLETVVEKEYDFLQYTGILHDRLMKILNEIEDAFYYLSGGKRKNEWPDELKKHFTYIRNKLLDEANDIKRLPNTLSYKGHKANEMSIGDFINRTMK